MLQPLLSTLVGHTARGNYSRKKGSVLEEVGGGGGKESWKPVCKEKEGKIRMMSVWVKMIIKGNVFLCLCFSTYTAKSKKCCS